MSASKILFADHRPVITVALIGGDTGKDVEIADADRARRADSVTREGREHLAGELVRARLGETVDAGDVLVDCSDLEFLDSDGVAPLLEVNRILQRRNRHLLLVNLRDVPRRKLEILGLWERLTGAAEPR